MIACLRIQQLFFTRLGIGKLFEALRIKCHIFALAVLVCCIHFIASLFSLDLPDFHALGF